MKIKTHIDPSLYKGRTFNIIEAVLGATPVIETPGGPNECVSVALPPMKVGTVVTVHGGINPATWGTTGGVNYGHPHGLPCMISFGKSNGDFSGPGMVNPGAGESALQGVVGGTGRGVLALNPDDPYVVNIAPRESAPPAGEVMPGMRVQVTEK